MSDSNPTSTIGQIAFDSGYTGESVIYIQEDGEYIPYIVVTNNYQGNCLLLRRDILPKLHRINEYDAYYENSEIDSYMNNEFLSSINIRQNVIVSSNITITKESSLGFSGSDTKDINRKVFLLSLTEIGVDDSVNTGKEGEALVFFEDSDNRLAYNGNYLASWWLRTPNSYYSSCTYAVGANGKIGYGNASDENGIRPAFCMDSATKIKWDNGQFCLSN